jgi:hypothetical protein
MSPAARSLHRMKCVAENARQISVSADSDSY